LQRQSRDANVRQIEWALRHEQEISDAVTEAKIGSRGHTGGAPSGHTFVSDPTAAQAIRKAEELSFVEIEDGRRVEWPERWLKVIAAVREWCGQDSIRSEVYKKRYQGRSSGRNLSGSTFYFVLWEIRHFSLQAAAQAQVIRVF